ncbi:MAG: hypothetical protein PUJ93_07310, partial [Oscillospiraceae bacterium]|nr:hypothetical protein [Oscillospiraceae bacterium]MDY5736504.1 hypothetical protein [Oscillospiraceae bacterium]
FFFRFSIRSINKFHAVFALFFCIVAISVQIDAPPPLPGLKFPLFPVRRLVTASDLCYII